VLTPAAPLLMLWDLLALLTAACRAGNLDKYSQDQRQAETHHTDDLLLQV
jgi:hypothetical protein